MPAAPNIPLGVRSVGRDELLKGVSIVSCHKNFTQLFWSVAGAGSFLREGRWYEQTPGSIFCYEPDSIHELTVKSDKWCYCWISFDHKHALNWLRDFDIKPGTQDMGACPESLFIEIADALQGCTLEGECRAAQLAYSLLLKASQQTHSSRPESLPSQFKALLDQRFTDPNLSLNTLSEELGVHRSTLTRQFSATYGMKPSSYLHNQRVQRGLNLLRSNKNQIQEIAHAAGFQDPNYFARAVRKATGLSPKEFQLS